MIWYPCKVEPVAQHRKQHRARAAQAGRSDQSYRTTGMWCVGNNPIRSIDGIWVSRISSQALVHGAGPLSHPSSPSSVG